LGVAFRRVGWRNRTRLGRLLVQEGKCGQVKKSGKQTMFVWGNTIKILIKIVVEKTAFHRQNKKASQKGRQGKNEGWRLVNLNTKESTTADKISEAIQLVKTKDRKEKQLKSVVETTVKEQ